MDGSRPVSAVCILLDRCFSGVGPMGLPGEWDGGKAFRAYEEINASGNLAHNFARVTAWRIALCTRCRMNALQRTGGLWCRRSVGAQAYQICCLARRSERLLQDGCL